MKNATLLMMAGLGTAIAFLASHRRTRLAKRREVEQRVELGRWESEGGAVPSNAPDPDEERPGQGFSWCASI